MHYYEQELRYLRELGIEFARRFPKVAGRLGMEDHHNSDPHLERLFQGFAFFASRVRQKLDGEFPALTERLLDRVYPHYLKPTPSMAVVQFRPTPNESSLTAGFTVPSGTELRARCKLAAGSVCEYRTAHSVRLWPVAIESLEYTSVLSSIADVRVPTRKPVQALLRIGLRLTGGREFRELALDRLPLYVAGGDVTSDRLYEALVVHAGTLVVRWGAQRDQHVAFGDRAQCAAPFGLQDEQALLPDVPPAYRGHRLLHEYFAFPARFRSVELQGLRAVLRDCTSDSVELIVPFTHHDPVLEGKLPIERLQLFATPAINLFPRRLVVAAPSGKTAELKLQPDRTQPLDYEIHSVTRVAAQTAFRSEPQQYRRGHEHGKEASGQSTPRFTVERRPRVPGPEEQRGGSRTDYVGTEVSLSLSEAPSENQQLVVDALCTNRDLPLLLAKDPKASFTLSSGAPVDEVRLLVGPSAPRYQPDEGETAWKLINNLQLNYLSLNEGTGASAALRELLSLYAHMGDPLLRREVEGVREIKCQSVVGPYPRSGPRNYVRGLEIQVICEEHAFAHGPLTLGTVLSQLFAKHSGAHSFTQTVLYTLERGEVYRAPAIAGQKQCV